MYIWTKYIRRVPKAFLGLAIHFTCIVYLLLFIPDKMQFIQKAPLIVNTKVLLASHSGQTKNKNVMAPSAANRI